MKYLNFLIFFVILVTSNRLYAIDYWYSFGDLRGYIEPCGCDPKSDLGGVKRIAVQLDEKRKNSSEMTVFDLGNNLEPTDLNGIKSKFIGLAIDELKPTASLFNVLEQKAKSETLGKRKYVLSNMSVSKAENITPFIKSEGLMIFGFVEPNKDLKNLKKFDHQLLTEWKNLSNNFNGKKFLLFSGSDQVLKKIAALNFFDSIISSNKADFKVTVDQKEKNNMGVLLRHQNPIVYMVPLGGQGLLRGGNFPDFQLPCSLNPLVKEKNCGSQNVNKLLSTQQKLVDWLTVDLQASMSSLDQLLTEYNSERQKSFDLKVKDRVKSLENSKFAGARTCNNCHMKQYDVWEKSKHAKAYETLKVKDKHKNEDCVKCHVLALGEPGGFVSEETSPQFSGVQCEECHGPAKEHTLDPSKFKAKKKVEKKLCEKCHHQPHSTEFNYDKYWEKIKH